LRKAIPMFTLLILLFSSMISAPNSALGATDDIKQIEQERKQVQSNLSKKEKQIVEVLEEIEALHKDIHKTEQELAKHDKYIAETEEEIVEYEEEFEQLVEEINELTEAIEARTDILNKQLATYQENGGDISYLEVLFNSKSFIDFISRVSSFSTLTNAEKDVIEQQIEDKNKIEKIQDTIIEKIEEQELLIEELEETKNIISEKQAHLKSSEKSLKQKEVALNKEKSKLTDEDTNLAQLEKSYYNRMKAREAEQVAQKDASEKVEKTAAKPSGETKSKAATSQANKSTSKKNSTNSSNSAGKDLNVGKTFKVEATAYTPNCNGCSGYTATGINVKGKNHQSIIAVDPKVIPLGSRVWVEGYGEAIAADTGGAIKGNRIDVLYKSKNQALQWGRRTVTVKVLN